MTASTTTTKKPEDEYLMRPKVVHETFSKTWGKSRINAQQHRITDREKNPRTLAGKQTENNTIKTYFGSKSELSYLPNFKGGRMSLETHLH